MANPQKENGYTAISNELLEKLISANLSGYELAIVLFIIRKTYGYGKIDDKISLSQFLSNVPTTKPTVCAALKRLQLVNLIKLVKRGKSKNDANLYKINKDYDTWQLVKQTKLVKNRKLTSKELHLELVKPALHTKENNKRNITKESIISCDGSQVNMVINVFYQLNNAINYANASYRKSAETLIKKYGVEKTINAAVYALSVQTKKYAPQIANPTQLMNKFGELIIYKQRESAEKPFMQTPEEIYGNDNI